MCNLLRTHYLWRSKTLNHAVGLATTVISFTRYNLTYFSCHAHTYQNQYVLFYLVLCCFPLTLSPDSTICHCCLTVGVDDFFYGFLNFFTFLCSCGLVLTQQECLWSVINAAGQVVCVI